VEFEFPVRIIRLEIAQQSIVNSFEFKLLPATPLLSWYVMLIGITYHVSTSKSIGRAANTCRATIEDMSIDHRCFDVIMSKEFLHCSYIVATFQQMSAKECLNVWQVNRFVNPALASPTNERTTFPPAIFPGLVATLAFCMSVP